MPSVPISDGFGLNLSAQLNPQSAFAEYFQNPPSLTALQSDLASLQDLPLSKFPLKSSEFGIGFATPASVSSTSPQFAGSAAVSATLCVVSQGKLFDPDPFGNPIDVPSGHAYVGLGVKAVVAPGVTLGSGKVEFGFTANSTVCMTHYQSFPATATLPTFGSALQSCLAKYIIPLSVDDLVTMEPGDVAVIEGTGSLRLSGTFNLLTSVNPLVSVSSTALPMTFQVQAGATVAITATCTITGDFQVRAQKIDEGTVRLGIYRKRGAEYSTQVSSSAGLTAGVGKTDFIAAVLGAVGPSPLPSAEQLKQAGLSEEKQKVVESALKAAIDRSLALSIQSQLQELGLQEVAFLYEVNLKALSPAARTAIQDALQLNLCALSESGESLPAGIREIQSILTTTRKRAATLKLNLLGIYDFTSVSELILKGTVLADPSSGEVVCTDSATANRISGAVNFLADGDKLRKAIAQSFLITAAYRCSGLISHAPGLKVSYWHFQEYAKTSRETAAANLEVLTNMGLMTRSQNPASLSGSQDCGRSTFYLTTDYDDALSQDLFLAASGQARGRAEYEAIGRKALQMLILPDSTDAYRLRAVEDGTWEKVKETGGTILNLAQIFPDLRPDLEIPVIAGDYVLIEWWAATMARMALSLSAAKRAFSQNPPPATGSPEFKKIEADLSHQMAAVASNTHDRFSGPWGLLAMDLASGQRSHAVARLVSPILTLSLERGQ